jgi:hypothetical protein
MIDGAQSLGSFSELGSRSDFVFPPSPPHLRTSIGMVLTTYLHVVYSSNDIVRTGDTWLDRSGVQMFARFFCLRDSLYCRATSQSASSGLVLINAVCVVGDRRSNKGNKKVCRHDHVRSLLHLSQWWVTHLLVSHGGCPVIH